MKRSNQTKLSPRRTNALRVSHLLLVLLLALLLTLTLASCAEGVSDGMESPNKGGDASGGSAEDLLTGSTAESETRKIIKTVNESVETESYDEFIDALKAAVSGANGYISSSTYNGDKESSSTRTAKFEIRIPAEGLDGFTGEIGALGTVVSYQETQEDISVAYVDVQSRIEVLEAERTALLDILANATYTSEMLEIRSHLEDVQAELASLEAQMRVYNDRIAYSTVHLSVREVEKEQEPVKETFFSKLGAAFLDSLSGALSFLEKLAIFFIGGSPYFVLFGLLGLAVFLSIYLPKRRRAKKRKEEKK